MIILDMHFHAFSILFIGYFVGQKLKIIFYTIVFEFRFYLQPINYYVIYFSFEEIR